MKVPVIAYSKKLSIYLRPSVRPVYPPLTDLPNMPYYLSRGMLQCRHMSVVNTNFATSAWKQAQIAYRPAGHADGVLNDCESPSR